MNIWIFNQFALPPTASGGTRHFDLADGLQGLGHSVTIIAGGMNYNTFVDRVEYGRHNHKIENVQNVKFIWIKTRPYKSNGMARIFNMIQFALRITRAVGGLEHPDIIIGSTVQPLAAWQAGRIANKYGVPFIFEIRDLWPQTMIDMGAWRKKSLISSIFYYIEKKTLELATSTITLSPLTQQYLLDTYSYQNVECIPNFVDIDRVVNRIKQIEQDETKNSTLAELKKLRVNGRKIALFTGAIVESNVLQVIYNSSRLKLREEFIFVLVGGGQMFAQYSRIADDRFTVLEPVPKYDVPELLELADVLLLVQGAVKWGSMNKLYDYLSSSVPIVAVVSQDHNLPVGGDLGVHSCEADPTELFNTIVEASENSPDRRKTVLALRRDMIRDRFSKNSAVRKIENHCKKALGAETV